MCFPLKKNTFSGPSSLIAEEFLYISNTKEERIESRPNPIDVLKNWTSDAQCKLQYLHRSQTERLTGPEALTRCLIEYSESGGQESCEVIFLVRANGITLTEVVSRHFFRRFLALETISFCGLDKNDRNIFGVVVRDKDENWCHIFSQFEERQPSRAIVKFINEQFSLNSCY